MNQHTHSNQRALLLAMGLLFAASNAGAVVNPSPVFVSELHYDNTGTDVNEFIEISGPAGTNLSGWALVLYNGNNGTTYNTLNLTGTIPNQTGGYGALSFVLAVNGLQNGGSNGSEPDGIALVNGASTLVEFLSYEGTFTGSSGIANGLVSTNIGVMEDSPVPAAGTSLKRTGVGLNNIQLTWAGPTAATPGALDFSPTAAVYTPRTIPAIQGSGAVSPFVGSLVRTTGTVTAVFPGLGGFYLQDAAGDGDPATSDGIFVQSTAVVTVGQTLQIDGSVAEQNQTIAGGDGKTTLVGAAVTVTGSNLVLPTNITLPEPTENYLERYESMLVNIQTSDSNRMRVAQTYFLGRYGQLTLTSPDDLGNNAAMVTPTQLFEPSPDPASPAQQAWASQQRRILVLDDGQDVDPAGDNPATVPFIGCTESGIPASRIIRAGDFAGNLTGILDWGRIDSSTGVDYRLQPLDNAAVTFTAANPRPTQPPNPTAAYEIVAFNVYNYFTSIIRTDSTARGAYDGIELRRQTEKLVDAIGAVNADILGLVELENNTEAIQVLVDGSDSLPGGTIDGEVIRGLNDVLGAGTYAYVQTGVTGTDRIKVGFIYKPSTTAVVGNHAVLPATVNSRSSLLTHNRPSIAQTFRRMANGQKFTVVVNHFKSKGSDCNAISDPDLGDLAGNCNLTRNAIATNLIDWIATDPTGSQDPDFLLIGDLNSYAQETPIDTLRAGGLVDLVARDIPVTQQQDYVFDGRIGNLTYAMATASLAGQIPNVAEWHINSDEAKVLDFEDFYNQVGCYDASRFRAADHDPLSVSLAAASPVPAVDGRGLWMLAAMVSTAGFVVLSRRRTLRV